MSSAQPAVEASTAETQPADVQAVLSTLQTQAEKRIAAEEEEEKHLAKCDEQKW